jgi:dihydrofolate reductase
LSRIVVIEYVSLDGVVQAPGHAEEDRAGDFRHGGWTAPFMATHSRYLTALFESAGGFLLGRLTYDIWASYWPTVGDDESEIARALNNTPKYVASRTLAQPTWRGTTVIRDIPSEVAQLRAQRGGPIIVMGSSVLVQTLTADGLVDEYRLIVHPVALGSGKRLFTEGGPRVELCLIDSTTTRDGLVVLTYEPR